MAKLSTLQTPKTPEHRAVLQLAQVLKNHQSRIAVIEQSHGQALKNIQKRDAEANGHLARLEQLQAETRLLKMDLNSYATDIELHALTDRVLALEKVSETPKERAERQSSQRDAYLWIGCCVGGSALLITGFLASINGRVSLLERRIAPQTQLYPGR